MELELTLFEFCTTILNQLHLLLGNQKGFLYIYIGMYQSLVFVFCFVFNVIVSHFVIGVNWLGFQSNQPENVFSFILLTVSFEASNVIDV